MFRPRVPPRLLWAMFLISVLFLKLFQYLDFSLLCTTQCSFWSLAGDLLFNSVLKIFGMLIRFLPTPVHLEMRPKVYKQSFQFAFLNSLLSVINLELSNFLELSLLSLRPGTWQPSYGILLHTSSFKPASRTK